MIHHPLFDGVADPPEFLTTREAADRIGVTSLEMVRWGAKSFGPHRFKDDQGYFYMASEVEEWAESSGWLRLKRAYVFPDPKLNLEQLRVRGARLLDRINRLPKTWSKKNKCWNIKIQHLRVLGRALEKEKGER